LPVALAVFLAGAVSAIWRRSSGWRWRRWFSIRFSNWQFVAAAAGVGRVQLSDRWLLITKQLRVVPRFADSTAASAIDLVVLGTFKYPDSRRHFEWMFSTGFVSTILLPVGISSTPSPRFCVPGRRYRAILRAYRLPHYALFVTYFPHLIAGPILHHKDMIPQIRGVQTKRPDPHLMLCGLIIFGIGCFQKNLSGRQHPPWWGFLRPGNPSSDQDLGSACCPIRSALFDFSAIRTWRSASR